jgi:nucleoside-diphosphate-sugar epimerase
MTGGSGFIGTNLIDEFLLLGMDFINIDVSPPKKKSHYPYWKKCDILEKNELDTIFSEYQPETVIHLAAETRVGGKNIDYYQANTIGTQNLLEVIVQCQSIRRTLFVSTQYVFQSNGFPKSDEDFSPLGVYGESKVLMEQLIRKKNLGSIWTIIRPTNIWGPWHNIYPEGLWRQILKGTYLHPGKRPVYRSYGYIGNVTMQIIQIMNGNKEDVHQQVFYVGDAPINLYDWVNAFSLKLKNKKVRIVPRIVLVVLAFVGDALGKFSIDFPLTISRYRNMVNDNPAPMKKTFSLCGPPKYSLQEGIDSTVKWYFEEYLKLK